MPLVEDPNAVLPPEKLSGVARVKPSQIIAWLLYPVIFAVGLSVGLVIGIKQGQANPSLLGGSNTNTAKVNSSIVPNVNNRVNTNTVNANTNTSNAFLNVSGGDYLKIDAATQAKLNQDKQKEKDTTVDQTASVTDILRQQDLINLKYDLKAYYLVHTSYPSTGGRQTRLERGATDVFYNTLKDFYGGSYNQPIDPEAPTYYYGYTSNGTTFELTAYLTSKKKPFVLSGP